MSSFPNNDHAQHGSPAAGPATPLPWSDVAPVATPVTPSAYLQPTPVAPGADLTYRAQVWDAATSGPGAPVTTYPLDVPVVHAPMVHPLGGFGRDPSRTALAAVITFICVIIGLWAALAYMHSMAVTLSSVDASNKKIIRQLELANVGLGQLEQKTSRVKVMRDSTRQLQALMAGIDGDMGSMLGGVERIGAEMGSMQQSLTKLDAEVTAVNETEKSLALTLEHIDRGMMGQSSQVAGMRVDVVKTSRELKKVPGVLRTTNARLTFINKVVCQMGAAGVINKLKLKITFFSIPNGSALIHATMIPPGGWAC